MIFALMPLALFNIIYGIGIIFIDQRGALSITVIAICFVIFFTVIIKEPESSLYAFLCISLFFPSTGNNFQFFIIEAKPGCELYTIMQSVAAFTIGFNVIKNHKTRLLLPRKLKIFCYLVAGATIIAFFLMLFQWLLGNLWAIQVKSEQLVWHSTLLNSLIFLYGCAAFIDDIKKIETMLFIFVFAGLELLLESIGTRYLGLSFLDSRAFHASGRFSGFAIADYPKMVLVIYGAIGCSLYFLLTKKQYRYLFLIPLLFLPSWMTYQRTPMAANVLIIVTFLLLALGRRQLRIILAGLFLCLAIFAFSVDPASLSQDSVQWVNARRKNYFGSVYGSWESRWGAHLRGLDIAIYTFPTGAGPGSIVHEFMANPLIPNYLDPGNSELKEAEQFYNKISLGLHETGPHNFIVYFIAAYGLLGLLALWFLSSACFSNYRRFFGKTADGRNEPRSKSRILTVMAFSILLGIVFHAIFYHDLFYWLLFFIFFLTFLAPKEQIRPRSFLTYDKSRWFDKALPHYLPG